MIKPYEPYWWEVISLEYVASYTDLMNAFGADLIAGDAHYRQHGQFEGRLVSFYGLEYIASYGDLISALGTDWYAGTSHYIQAGRFEGRTTTFDGLEYIASYPDLIGAFGTQVAAYSNTDVGTYEGTYVGTYLGTNHYIVAGHSEGRAADQFDAAQYLANYSDLQAAFGADTDLATQHYIIAGYAEGRNDDPI